MSIEKMNKEPKNIITRVDPLFREQMNEIREVRKEKGKEELSDRKQTSLIPKHKNWQKIKGDLIEYEDD